MEKLKFDNGIYSKIKTCTSVNELAEVVMQLTEELIVWKKVLEDTLSNLDSDNIKSIDFSVTQCKNIDSILAKYTTN
ncbi:MAG: hypothetical protein IJM94_02405 [Clostridia bacterium]|nr:hypothetical protein [Clostridia bacterium]